MRPVLFNVGGLGIPTHDFFMLLGVMVAGVVYRAEMRRRRMSDQRLVFVAIGAVIGGGFMARLSTGWQYLVAADDPTLGGLWLQGGRSILGGLAGAYFGALAAKRLIGYRSSTGDLFAPAVALGIAVGRIGCFLTEQVGTPTSLPWGIRLDPQAAARLPFCPSCATGLPMHPSFLYEIAFLVGLFFVLRWLRSASLPQGELFKIFLFSYGVFRFFVEFVRDGADFLGPLSGSQLFLLVTMPLLGLYFLRRWRAGTYRLATA